MPPSSARRSIIVTSAPLLRQVTLAARHDGNAMAVGEAACPTGAARKSDGARAGCRRAPRKPSCLPAAVAAAAYYFRLGSMPLQASIRPCTEATDLANIAFSSSLVENSITFSAPPAPITTGTPT